MSTPAFSIVVPTHSRVDLFLETLESVKNQTFEDFELIVTDDSPSPRDREQIQAAVEDYQKTTNRLAKYLFTEPTLGQPRNTNQGLRAACGKYIRILHSDDILAPNCIENEFNALSGKFHFKPELLFHELTPFKSRPNFPKDPQLSVICPRAYFNNFLHSGTPVPSCIAFSKELLDEAGLLDESYKFLCDWEFFFRLLQTSHRRQKFTAYISKGYVGWRTHANSISGKLWLTHFHEHQHFSKILKEKSDNPNNTIFNFGRKSYFFDQAKKYRYQRLTSDYLALPMSKKGSNFLKYFSILFSKDSLSRFRPVELYKTIKEDFVNDSTNYSQLGFLVNELVMRLGYSYLKNKDLDELSGYSSEISEQPNNLMPCEAILLKPLTPKIAQCSDRIQVLVTFDNLFNPNSLKALFERASDISVHSLNKNKYSHKTLSKVLKSVQSEAKVSFYIQDNEHLTSFGLKALVEKVAPGQFAWDSQITHSPSVKTIRYKRCGAQSAWHGEAHTGWTFGMLTLGTRKEAVEAFVTSIENYCKSAYEIIFVCPDKAKLDCLDKYKNIKIIEFSEHDDLGWITKKKNLIAEHAQYSDMLICHDRYYLDSKFFDDMENFGYSYGIAAPRVVDNQGARMVDWAVVSSENFVWSTGGLLNYADYSRYAYAPGGANIVRKAFWKVFAWNENLFWNEHEDVELCRRVQRAGEVIDFFPATLVTTQDRWIDHNPMIPFNEKRDVLYGEPKGEQKVEYLNISA